MAKITLNDISNLTGNPTTAETALNDNFTRIEEAIENTLSRDGTIPNFLEASLDANSQRIVNLPYALSGSEPVTLAQVYALVTGEDWTGGGGLPSVVFYKPNQPTATAAGQVWVDSDDLSIWIWTGTDWVRQADPNLQLAINTANNASLAVGALEPRVLAVEQDSAAYNLAIIELENDVGLLAGSIATTSADLDDLTAAVSVETLARIQGDEALASAINSIQAFTNKIYVQASAPLDSPPGTLDEGDFWYDSDDGNHPYRWVSGAWVSVQDTSYTAPLYAAIESEQTARISGDAALANSVLSLQAQRESDYSLIVNNQLASVNADSALASDITSLQVSMTSVDGSIGSLSASITNEQNARIAGDNANASSISTLNSTVGGLSTSVSTLSSTVNGINGRFTVQIDSNGYVSGIDLIQNAAQGTTPYSSFTVSANAFRVATPSTNVVPFQVVNGITYIEQVRIKGSVIDSYAISTPKIATGAVTDNTSVELNLQGNGPSSGSANVWINVGLVGYGTLTTTVNDISLFDPLDPASNATTRGRSHINLRFTATGRGFNGNAHLLNFRVLRSDGVVLSPATLGVPNQYAGIAWEWWDRNPTSTSHTYTLQMSRPDGSNCGQWYSMALHAVNFKK